MNWIDCSDRMDQYVIKKDGGIIEEVEKDYDDATLELRKAKDTLYKYLATEEFETDCLEVVYEDSDDTE